jgi:hypothetical protein
MMNSLKLTSLHRPILSKTPQLLAFEVAFRCAVHWPDSVRVGAPAIGPGEILDKTALLPYLRAQPYDICRSTRAATARSALRILEV